MHEKGSVVSAMPQGHYGVASSGPWLVTAKGSCIDHSSDPGRRSKDLADWPGMYACDVDGGGLAGCRKRAKLAKVIDLVANTAGDKADRPSKIWSGFLKRAVENTGLSCAYGHDTRLFARR